MTWRSAGGSVAGTIKTECGKYMKEAESTYDMFGLCVDFQEKSDFEMKGSGSV